ncbi:aspartate-semialdehyde dehydrogenase [Bacteroidales bacterium OttesenSCG-928-K03]|nr:aspartate-semialdehyde dehydrogenase [Odoribacter sp. OttesenSCG-928-L07]MDL2242201.1 aspartate-semialdehyde dehydrogenase [Bacteroidales bacterium OttesenSCG-928-K03]
MKIAIIGCTGVVGSIMLKVLEEQQIPISDLLPVASIKSIGKNVSFNNENYKIISIEEAIERKPDFAIFSAGKEISKKYAPLFVNNGTTVIDNSSAWRMNNDVPLVVPEINFNSAYNNKLIANPNCSTIQMVLAIHELHNIFKIKRLVASTYQSVSGSGAKGINQLFAERKGADNSSPAYPHQIDLNIIPHGGAFLDNGYTEEEIKLVDETRKILNDNSIQITATVVRVPVTGGHSISLNIEFEKDFTLDEIYSTLKNTSGITVMDDIKNNIYPTPLFAEGKDDVFVGRIRRDFSAPNSLNIWITADNLRKGAATNAVQILKGLLNNH